MLKPFDLQALFIFLCIKVALVTDPCSGSGHFLVYAFEVLMNIYRECGWMERDAARSILENNLFGLDIDNRAGQLSYFAVMMKARKYDRRILEREISPHVYTIQSSEAISDELIHYVADHDRTIEKALVDLRQAFIHAKDLGSITIVPEVDCDRIYNRLRYLHSTANESMVEFAYSKDADQYVAPIVAQADLLTREYDIVVTNPPYLNRMNAVLKSYVNEHYKDYSADLFSVFIYQNLQLCKPRGYAGYMSPFVWMFIKSYEKLRTYIIQNHSFTTLIQFEYSAYEEATVPICTFVLKKGRSKQKGLFFKLSDFKGGMEIQKQKTLEALHNNNCGYFFEADSDNFSKIPGSPVAYWLSNKFINMFENDKLMKSAVIQEGLKTGDNNRFIRYWFEVSIKDTNIVCEDAKWIKHTKGGEFRKWYGNNDEILNYANNGKELRQFKGSSLTGTENYFLENITWNRITSNQISVRYTPPGSIPNMAGLALYPTSDLFVIIAYMNTVVVQQLLDAMNPTINYPPGTIAKIPFLLPKNNTESVEEISKTAIQLSQSDWDSFETSWDFKKHPLI